MFTLTPDRWELCWTILGTWSNLRGEGLRATVAGTPHLRFLNETWIFTTMLGEKVMSNGEWTMGAIDPEVMVEVNR